MTDIIDHIEKIEKLIFNYHIQTAMRQFTNLTEELIQASESLSPSRLEDLCLIIHVMNIALQSKDYLLLNDTLEYELKPFIAESLS